MSRLALVVEPSPAFGSHLEAILHAARLKVLTRCTLEDARKDIATLAPAVVVTSLKLGSFNGVHLVYLAKLANPSAICIVYGEAGVGRAEEAQGAGAIYVQRECMSVTLPGILGSVCAPADKTHGNGPVPGRLVDFRLRSRL